MLVELVQLLLNKKVLQFRKGRVSVTATASVAALSSFTPSDFSALSLTSPHSYGSGSVNHNSAGRSSSAVESGRVGSVMKPSLMAVPHVSTPSDRAFIPASILPFTCTFNAVNLLSSLCSLRRSTAPSSYQQYPSHLPLYHYEQTASTTTPSAVWVSVCTVVFRAETTSAHSVAREFKSTQHESKSAAQQESARRALQEALWYLCFDRCLSQLKQLEHRHREGESRQQRQLMRIEEQRRTELEERHQQVTADSVRQLDRHLAFLGQVPIAYTLQSHVMQNSAGARTLWQARGQVMLEGLLLPGDRVRLRAWNGGEMVLSSTPLVAYAAEARKTQAKALVSQQLLSKMATTTAAHANLPLSRTPSSPASVAYTTPPSRPSQPAAHRPVSAGSMSASSGAAWRSTATPPPAARNCVPLTSNTLFAFPSCNDLEQQQLSGNYGDDVYGNGIGQPQRSEQPRLLGALSECGGEYEREDVDGKQGEDDCAEGEEFIYSSFG